MELIGLQLLIDNSLSTNACVLYYIIFVFSQIAKYSIEKTTHPKHIISRNVKLILLPADALNSKDILSHPNRSIKRFGMIYTSLHVFSSVTNTLKVYLLLACCYCVISRSYLFFINCMYYSAL